MDAVKTRDELYDEYQRLMEEDRLEEASAVLDQIEPLSDEEWLEWVHGVEEVDEPVPAFIRERSRELSEWLAQQRVRNAG